MVEVIKETDSFLFNVKGLHKLWAFKSQLRIPSAHIRGARQDTQVAKGWWKGLRAPGTHVPGLIIAGTFYKDSKRIFWDVQNAKKAIVIDLEHDNYQQIIIEVDDPAAVVALLTAERN